MNTDFMNLSDDLFAARRAWKWRRACRMRLRKAVIDDEPMWLKFMTPWTLGAVVVSVCTVVMCLPD